MSESARHVPQRIGDAERDQAAEYLREHMAAGRLDVAEFEERLTAALKAKLQPDLDRLFIDLPSPTPRSPAGKAAPTVAARPGSHPGVNPPIGLPPKTRNTIDLLVGIAWPITIALCFVIGWGQVWWLIFAPMLVTSLWEKKKQQDAAELKRWEREHRRLEPGPGDPGTDT